MITDTITVAAPGRLDASSRFDFQREAIACIERTRALGGDALVVDLGETREVDAGGLGLLVLLHKKAREQGMRTRLLHASSAVRSLLSNARLEPLFQFDAS